MALAATTPRIPPKIQAVIIAMVSSILRIGFLRSPLEESSMMRYVTRNIGVRVMFRRWSSKLLLIQLFISSLAFAQEEVTLASVDAILTGKKAPKTVEEFIAALPKSIRSNFVLVYNSG